MIHAMQPTASERFGFHKQRLQLSPKHLFSTKSGLKLTSDESILCVCVNIVRQLAFVDVHQPVASATREANAR